MVAKQCRIDGIPDKKSPKNQKINKPKAGAFQANPSSIPYQLSISTHRHQNNRHQNKKRAEINAFMSFLKKEKTGLVVRTMIPNMMHTHITHN
jgi:hypothetical protein